MDSRHRPIDPAGGASRFWSGRLALACACGTLVLASIGTFSVFGDGEWHYAFLQRLFGDREQAFAYQFGVAIWQAPFYAAAGLVDLVGPDVREESVGVAAAAALVLTLWLGWRLLESAALPARLAVLLATVLGTPLWYYVVFAPSYSHAVDTAAYTAAALALLRTLQTGSIRWILAFGAVLGALPVIRYANVAALPGLFLPLLLHRQWRPSLQAAAACVCSGAVLAAVPLLFGIDYGTPSTQEEADVPNAAGATARVAFDALVPLKMLFTLQRGLFLWTPLTVLAVVGLVLLARSRPDLRRYLVGLLGAGVGLLGAYSFWANSWHGDSSFSQRFLTGLFPLFLVGVAELVRRVPRALALVAVATAWSVFIGLNHFYGYEGASGDDGVDDIVSVWVDGDRTPAGFARLVGARVVDRWTGAEDP